MNHCFRLGLQCNQGEKHSRSKLTEADVINIKELRKMGMTYESIANFFCVSSTAIGKVCRGERWSHVKGVK